MATKQRPKVEPAPIVAQQTEEPSKNADLSNDLTKKQAKDEWLKPYFFKPGQSGNPGGVPGPKKQRRKILTQALEWVLDLPYPPNQKKTLEKMVGMKLRNDFTCAHA